MGLLSGTRWCMMGKDKNNTAGEHLCFGFFLWLRSFDSFHQRLTCHHLSSFSFPAFGRPAP